MFRKLSLILLLFFSAAIAKAQSQYSGAPVIPTEGSASYTNISSAINTWATSLNPSNNKAMDNRSAIIDEVENTVTAAGKDLITDAEYDALANALYFWLNQVATEGRTAANPMIGWDMVDITLANEADCPVGTQAVWRLCNDDVPIGNSTVVAHNNSRIVMFVSGVYYTGHEPGHDVEPTTTPLGDVKITRGTSYSSNHANLFKTEGNGEIIFFGKSGHRIYADGSQGSWGNYPDPTSYDTVNARNIPEAGDSYGQLVWVNSGRLLSSYTTFCNNLAGSGGGISHPFTVTNDNHFRTGGAVMFNGAVSTSAFYKSDFKNNAIAQQDGLSGSFGGAVGCGDITTLTDGIYFNQCDIVGNLNETHGGAFGFFFDGLGEGQANAGQLVIRDCNFQYNSQRLGSEAHGGGIFYRDTGRSCHLFNCTFDNNYAHGITAGGGAISNEGHIYINGCTFTNNMADNSFGGAIYTRPVMSLGFESKVIDIELDNCTFGNNKCTWTGNVAGASSSDIERGSGGALHLDIYRTEGEPETVTYSCTLNIKGNTTFENNTADRNGGAIAIDMMQKMKEWASTHLGQITSNLNIKSATISGNTITDKVIGDTEYTSVSKNGGAIYLSYTNLNVGELGSADVLVVKDNDTNGLGGAAYINNGNLVLNSGSLGVSGHPNTAPEGGGVYINTGNFELNGGSLGYNVASTGNGGGAYLKGGNIQMSAGTIMNNTAANSGGGLYVSVGSATISGGSILNNTATNGNGGGMVVEASGASITLNGSVANGNDAINGNGGAFFLGSGAKISLQDGSIEDNGAKNGGAIYLSDGAYFEYKTSATGDPGYIKGNSATNLGGGIYLAQGTTSNKTEMKFTLRSTNLGFYDNTAEVGGDDIYAYGNGTTTINIPNVQSMNLGGYSIPGATLEWWEDYKVNDSRYSEGTEQGDPSNITRYRASRDADEPIWKVPKLSTTPLSTFSEKYLCLTLGFEYGKIEIRRAGLKPNENAIYEVKFGDGSQRDIQRVVVYGSDEEGIDVDNKHWNVAKVSFLPKGQYTVTEIPWTWYNKNTNPEDLSKTQDISVDNGHIFKFENAHHNLTETPLHDEEFKINNLVK